MPGNSSDKQRSPLPAARCQAFYPAFLDISGKPCIVVGGGAVAERKARGLLACGADLTVISPDLTGGLERLKRKGLITHHERRYRRGDLRGAVLVIAATSDPAVNRQIARHAKCPVTVVDQPEIGSMIIPSVVRRGVVSFAVSTFGTSPAAARTIRRDLEKQYPKSVGEYIGFIGKLRERALKAITDRQAREKLFRELASPAMIECARSGGYRQAAGLARKLYTKHMRGIV